MTPAVVPADGYGASVCRLMRRQVPVQRATPRMQVAVGFEPDALWISAQCGELAIRKETRRGGQATSIALWHETDVVRIDLGGDWLIVRRASDCVDVQCLEQLPAVRALLASSAAVDALLALGTELEPGCHGHAPEITLRSLIHLLRALLAGDDWTWFLEDESEWADALRGVRPRSLLDTPLVPSLLSDYGRPYP